MTAATDSGVSNTDNYTNVKRPTFTGQAPAGSWVELLIDGVSRGSQQLAAGVTTYSITANADLSHGNHAARVRIAENSSIPAANRSRQSNQLDFTVDLQGPRPTGVTVRNVVSGGNSYVVPTATNSAIQIQPVHLVNGVRSIEIAFGEDVYLPTPGGGQQAVQLWDVASGLAVQYTSATASEISPGLIRLTNNANITLAKLWVRVKSSEIANGLQDLAGNYLDGNWTNPVDHNDNTGNSAFSAGGSGNGVNGGTFDFKVNVSKGDTDGDLDIDLDDLNNVRNNFGGTGLGDTDWDGDVDLDDLNNVRNNFAFDANIWPALSGGQPLYGEQRLRQALRDLYFARLSGAQRSAAYDQLFHWQLLGDEEWWKVTLFGEE